MRVKCIHANIDRRVRIHRPIHGVHNDADAFASIVQVANNVCTATRTTNISIHAAAGDRMYAQCTQRRLHCFSSIDFLL